MRTSAKPFRECPCPNRRGTSSFPWVDEWNVEKLEIFGVAGSKRRVMRGTDGSNLHIEPIDRGTEGLPASDDARVNTCCALIEGKYLIFEFGEQFASEIRELLFALAIREPLDAVQDFSD